MGQCYVDGIMHDKAVVGWAEEEAATSLINHQVGRYLGR